MTRTIPYLTWRDGRPRWIPGPEVRAMGFRGQDLKNADGQWLNWDDAAAVAVRLNWRVEGRRCAAAAIKAGRPAARRKQRGPVYAAECILDEIGTTNLLNSKGGVMRRCYGGPFIYVFGVDGRLAKIGYSTNPDQRMKKLATGMPFALCGYVVAPGTVRDEAMLHLLFAEQRLQNEWFRIGGALGNWLQTCSAPYRKCLGQSRRERNYGLTERTNVPADLSDFKDLLVSPMGFEPMTL